MSTTLTTNNDKPNHFHLLKYLKKGDSLLRGCFVCVFPAFFFLKIHCEDFCGTFVWEWGDFAAKLTVQLVQHLWKSHFLGEFQVVPVTGEGGGRGEVVENIIPEGCPLLRAGWETFVVRSFEIRSFFFHFFSSFSLGQMFFFLTIKFGGGGRDFLWFWITTNYIWLLPLRKLA